MGLCKLIVIVGVAALVMQPSQSASIGGQSNACLCTREYFPVCGSDGQTYSNKCVFECEKAQSKDLELMFNGDCADQPANDEMCICTRDYDPICGTDGTTYSNKCMFKCEQKTNKALKFASYGQCVEISNLPMDNGVPRVQNLPVDNKIPEIQNLPMDNGVPRVQNLPMDNKIPEIQNLPMDNVIPEVQQYGAPCLCTREYNPICGSDGQTYSNKCMFNCEQKINRNLEILTSGECLEISNLPMDNVIPEVQNLPLDGEIPEVQNLPLDNVIPEVHNLPLDDEVMCACAYIYDPVCGTDGQTYSNKCVLKCAQKTNKQLELFATGACDQLRNFPVQN